VLRGGTARASCDMYVRNTTGANVYPTPGGGGGAVVPEPLLRSSKKPQNQNEAPRQFVECGRGLCGEKGDMCYENGRRL